MRLLRAAALAAALAACGGGAAAPVDAGPDAAPDAWAGPPAPPAPPALGAWACPTGWTSVPDDELAAFAWCEPPAPAAVASCAPGEAPALGRADCRRLGAACPAGDYAEGASGTVLHVKAGAPPGGDGSAAAPFDTLAAAITAAPAGATILLSKGTHAAGVGVTKTLVVRGACAAETVLKAPPPPPGAPSAAAIVVSAGTPTLRDLTLTGPRLGVRVSLGASATLEGVRLDRLVGAAVHVDGGGVTVRASAITDTQLYGNGERGFAVLAVAGGQATVRDAVLAGNHQQAVRADDATIALEDVVIADTRPIASGVTGNAIGVTDGGKVTVERAWIDGSTEAAFAVAGAGASVRVTDAVVLGTVPRPRDGQSGAAVVVVVGEVTLERVLLVDHARGGVWVQSPNATATLTDVVVRDAPLAPGVGSSFGGAVTLERVVVERTTGHGVLVPDGRATLRDVVVRDVALGPGGIIGYGLQIGHAGGGETITAERVLVTRAHTAAVLVDGGVLQVADLEIRDTRSDAGQLKSGRALHVQRGARVEGARVRVSDSLTVGVVAFLGAAIVLEDVVVERTAPHPCGQRPQGDPDVCDPSLAAGTGVGVGEASTIDLRRFRLADNALCGAQLVAGELWLADGEVASNAIGVNVQVPGYDVAGRLQANVRYVDNAVNLDARDLPMPPGP